MWGIDCGTACSHEFDADSVVTLTATPEGSSSFGGWSGACSGRDTCSVTMDTAKSVTAAFNPPGSHSLSVTLAGTGAGTVMSEPTGIDCGSDCTEQYDEGTEVVLTASPDAGSTFGGWSGGGCSGTDTCVVTVDAATPVTATFTLDQHELTVVKGGTGTGTVTSSPAGIDCGTDCSEAYGYDTV
ncbi:MAG: InlB B-repeat-containing protein, partial [Planctomycetota bacterium]